MGEAAAAALGQDKDGERCNGLSVYVEGGRGWEIEEGLSATRDQWLGKEPNKRLMEAVAWLASVGVHLYNIRLLHPVTLSGCGTGTPLNELQGAAWTSDQ